MLAARSTHEELMDAADLPPAELARVLHDLARVNTLTLARRPTLSFLARTLGPRKTFRLLDVGFGDGDMLRTIARWAAKHGIAAELTGIDLNPNAAPAARAATPPDIAIDWQTGDYAALTQPFDIIISSLVAHHMTHAQLVAFLRFMEARAGLGWFVNDLHRHGFAWAGFPLLATLMRVHPIVRHDGQLSIARSYRPPEWLPILAEAGASQAEVRRVFPFRLCVSRVR